MLSHTHTYTLYTTGAQQVKYKKHIECYIQGQIPSNNKMDETADSSAVQQGQQVGLAHPHLELHKLICDTLWTPSRLNSSLVTVHHQGY